MQPLDPRHARQPRPPPAITIERTRASPGPDKDLTPLATIQSAPTQSESC